MFLFEWPLYESLNPAFLAVFAFIGALFGSFFNVLSQRWGNTQLRANDEQSALWLKLRGVDASIKDQPCKPLMGGRSSCPHCKAPIPLYRNIPLVSWLLQRGKTSCCKQSISIRYLAFEVVGAALFTAVAWLISPSMYALTISIMLMILVLISVVDLHDGFIPDSLLMISAGIGLALTTHENHWITPAVSIEYLVLTSLCVILFFTLLSKLVGRGVIGGADQYLLGISASIQGPVFFMTLPVLLVVLIISAMLIKSGRVKRGFFTRLIDAEKSVPAGPAISISIIVGVFIHLSGIAG